jgi:hypothetical protein
MAQGIGPEFKPQYRKKKKKRDSSNWLLPEEWGGTSRLCCSMTFQSSMTTKSEPENKPTVQESVQCSTNLIKKGEWPKCVLECQEAKNNIPATTICFLLFFFFAVLGFELRASTLTHFNSPLFVGFLEIGSHYLPGLALNHDLCLLSS